LDAPVQKYVPTFPDKPWPITPRHLITHTSGIRHYKQGEIEGSRRCESLMEALDLFQKDPLLFEPGTKYSYSSFGTNLLGSVVEGASKQKFTEYVRDYICRPAGLERTRPDDCRELIPGRARGYFKTAAGELRNAPIVDNSSKIPAGGYCSTAPDLAKYALALLGGILVKKQTFEQMCIVQKTRDGIPTAETKEGVLMGHGLGWYVFTDKQSRKVVRFGGSQPGTRA